MLSYHIIVLLIFQEKFLAINHSQYNYDPRNERRQAHKQTIWTSEWTLDSFEL